MLLAVEVEARWGQLPCLNMSLFAPGAVVLTQDTEANVIYYPRDIWAREQAYLNFLIWAINHSN